MIERSQVYAAKIFGVIYFLSLAIITVVFSRFYAPYLVWENGEETARRLFTHQHAVRLYMAGASLYGAGLVVLLIALYMILRAANPGLALFAAFSKLIYVVFWFIVLLDTFAALRVLGGAGSLRTFGSEGLSALAGSHIDSGWDAYYIGLAFNGLGSAVFALVFFQSRYVPRSLALWGVLASLFEGFCGLAYLIYPRFGRIISVNSYELPAVSFEVMLCLWLLF